MQELMTVMLLGLSAEGLVICPFFAFGLGLSDRYTAWLFLYGRILGLILFGVVASILGNIFKISELYTNIGFGVLLLSMGIHHIFRSRRRILFLKKNFNWPFGFGCKNNDSIKFGFGLGVFRGFINPGRKYVYLLPMLLGVGIVKGLALSFIFALSSSVYLIIGIISAKFIENLIPYKSIFGLVGGIILLIIGAFYAFRGILLLNN
jgi:cytochrome c biogenesis protein CcdA